MSKHSDAESEYSKYVVIDGYFNEGTIYRRTFTTVFRGAFIDFIKKPIAYVKPITERDIFTGVGLRDKSLVCKYALGGERIINGSLISVSSTIPSLVTVGAGIGKSTTSVTIGCMEGAIGTDFYRAFDDDPSKHSLNDLYVWMEMGSLEDISLVKKFRSTIVEVTAKIIVVYDCAIRIDSNAIFRMYKKMEQRGRKVEEAKKRSAAQIKIDTEPRLSAIVDQFEGDF